MDRWRTLRNVAIIVAIAAAVRFIPGGGRAASAFEAALWSAFVLGFAYLALRWYREHRISVHGLGDRHRALLYLGLGLVFFEWAARARMWLTSLGELVWFLLAGFAVWAFLEVFRRWRAY
jgi:hypothetical protein